MRSDGGGVPVSRGIYELCLCGHRYPEHSMFDVCHGCSDCEDVDEGGGGSDEDHPYRQCECREFRSVDEQQIAG
jgi:hypothetical protein